MELICSKLGSRSVPMNLKLGENARVQEPLVEHAKAEDQQAAISLRLSLNCGFHAPAPKARGARPPIQRAANRWDGEPPGTLSEYPYLGSPGSAFLPVPARIMNCLSRLLKRLSRPTPLESGVLEKTCAMLGEPENRILRLQIQLAVFQRHPLGRSVEFRYRERPPAIRRLANCQSIHRAVLALRGSISGFSTVATVRLAKGVLSSLDFDPIPWTADESLEIETQFVDFGDSVPNTGSSGHGGEPNRDEA